MEFLPYNSMLLSRKAQEMKRIMKAQAMKRIMKAQAMKRIMKAQAMKRIVKQKQTISGNAKGEMLYQCITLFLLEF